MWLITVKTFDEQTLRFTLKNKPLVENNRVQFIDERTGIIKDFPYNRCIIEEVKA